MEKIEKYLTTLANKNKEDIQTCNENIEKAEQGIEKANTDLMSAEAEVNAEKYNKAKNDIWTAQHSKELHLKHKEKLATEPLITKTEYDKLLGEITQTANTAHEEQNDRAVALIAELKKIADESNQTSQHANKLMHKLQREVFKEPTGVIPLPNGGKTYSSDKEYKNPETVHNFYQSKIQGSLLAKRLGEQEQQAMNKYWGQ